jgi:hypothetical protein
VVATENKKQCKSIERERRKMVERGTDQNKREKERRYRKTRRESSDWGHNLITCISPSIAQN